MAEACLFSSVRGHRDPHVTARALTFRRTPCSTLWCPGEFCNETLKRNKVEQHMMQCRGCWMLSCMDCNMRFEGKAYLDHTTCVTEAQRYQGALYVHKENKGEVKQEAWSSSVQTKVAKASATLRPYAEKLIAYDNVPRKKAKFINFAKNSLNLKHDPKGICEQLWDLIGEAPATVAAPSAESMAAAEAAKAAKVAEAAEAAEAAKAAKERLEAKEAAAKAAAYRSAKPADAEAKAAKSVRKAAKAAAKAESQASSSKDSGAKPESSAPVAAAGASTDPAKKRKRDEDEEDKAVSARPVDGLWVECAAAVPLRLPGKRQKGEPQPPIDTATKPIKWKAIITKELESVGGTMSLKELRRAAVAEVQAHPSHQGRKAKQLKEEFDEVFPTFHKYAVVDGQVALATKAEAMAGVT